MLGGIAAIAFILFAIFAQYSIRATEHEFEERSRLLTNTLASESVFNVLMQDTDGLSESLNRFVEREVAVAGGFYDADGNVLVENNLSDTFAADDLMLDDGVLRHTETKDGAPVVLTASDIVRTNSDDEGTSSETIGSVVMAIPAQALQQQQTTSILLSVLILLVIAGVASFIYYKVGQTITNPLNTLRDAASAVEDGDLSVRVEVDQNDEIGELASSFNAMVEASEKKTRLLDEERQYLKRQVDRISGVINAVTEGDLTQRLEVERDDAVGTLIHQINDMVSDLAAIIYEVRDTSNELSGAAQVVASSADQMSKGAQEQAQQTSSVAASVEEMSSTVATTSQHAHDSNEVVRQASELGAEGEKVFDETAEGMGRIARHVNDSADQVSELGRSSQEIGEIIEVIGDIADQTNLLALNAAIEAARAGEQGRGFAVVADEVRQLAERTTEATSKVADMITRIQKNTDKVVGSMERSKDEVETGLTLIDDASDALKEVVSSIQSMESRIDQIARASEQQAAASNEIAENVDSISSVADEVSRSTTELATMADDMNQQAHSLRTIVDRFQVSDEHDPSQQSAEASLASSVSVGNGAASYAAN